MNKQTHSKFNYDWTPYCSEILKLLNTTQPAKRIVVLKGAAQGITECISNGKLYIVSTNKK